MPNAWPSGRTTTDDVRQGPVNTTTPDAPLRPRSVRSSPSSASRLRRPGVDPSAASPFEGEPQGELLNGASFNGWSCVRWDNDADFQCQICVTTGRLGQSSSALCGRRGRVPAVVLPRESVRDGVQGSGRLDERQRPGSDRPAQGRRRQRHQDLLDHGSLDRHQRRERSTAWVADEPGYASGLKSGSPLIINKVDASGALLPGATFEGWNCTAFDGDPEFTCTSFDRYPWFTQDLTTTGTTGDHFSQEIVMEGGWMLPVNDCLVLREVSAPAGYVTRSAPLMVCKGPEAGPPPTARGSRSPRPGPTSPSPAANSATSP